MVASKNIALKLSFFYALIFKDGVVVVGSLLWQRGSSFKQHTVKCIYSRAILHSTLLLGMVLVVVERLVCHTSNTIFQDHPQQQAVAAAAVAGHGGGGEGAGPLLRQGGPAGGQDWREPGHMQVNLFLFFYI